VTRARLLTGLLYGLTLVAVFTIAVSSLTEFDFWWYLKSGELILAERRVPTRDPFSFTALGDPWINHMWLSQVLVVSLWRTSGRLLLIVLKGILVAATFAVVLLTMRRRGVHPIVAAAITLLAAAAGWEFWDVRPQVVTYLLVAVYLYLLREGWETRRAQLVWLPLLMIPWANLHAGFVTGIGLIGLVGVGTALPRLLDRQRRRQGWRTLGLALELTVAAGLASLVNPYGIRAIVFPLEVVNTRLFMTAAAEWFSPNFHNPAYRGFELMVLLLVPAFSWGRARLRVTDVLLAGAFTHLALASARHVPLFAVAVAPLLADALQAAAGALAGDRFRPAELAARLHRRLPNLGPILVSGGGARLAAALAILVWLVGAWGSFLDPVSDPFLLDLNERRYPERTMTFIKAERLPAPLFNANAWGGFELWRLYPDYRVFIDRRTHVYGREILQDFFEVTTIGPRWQAVLDKWNIQTVLTDRGSKLTQVLLAVGGWHLVFAERDAAVFVRETPAHQPLLARLPPVTMEVARPEVTRALAAGLSAAETGDTEAAIRHYREALTLVPDHPVALMSLGLLQQERGRTFEARALFERIVELYRDGELVQQARGRLEKLR
jgi:tetratricopeptide (TPR) repeat protein